MTIETAKQSLKHAFGFNEFRPLQEEIVETVLAKRDCLVLMPTGGGKSLCYQLPATVQSGITIVVSPLIALMKDQVEGLVENGIAASYINSSLEDDEIRDIEKVAINGEIQLLYVSPEKLVSQFFQYFLHELNISLFAIDEAHCISSWGHDFRKEYTQLSQLKRQFPEVPIIALTATADKLTRQDILSQLELKNPKVYISSFDRPNLQLTVLPGRKRIEKILAFLKKRKNESGIIYCLSRKQTEKVATALQQAGYNASYYHAGLRSPERAQTQEDFVHGRVPIICATIAFGMGIDKSNVRFVIHHNLPKNLEGYYQEIGRAGRDGLPSEAVLFYSIADVILLKKFASDSGQPQLQLAKLERMQQYSDALICRRKILLSYFGEHKKENCGNCDVCHNPPTLFDGTDIARKALSAMYRMEEKAPVNMVIDVLRGSVRHDIVQRGYDQIKTHGAGKDIPFPDWQQYILQMLNMGLVDIAYDQNNALKITPAGIAVLKGEHTIQLVTLTSIEERAAQQVLEKKPRSKRQEAEEELFERLREMRKQIARKADIPPYLVFTDATLDEMVSAMPVTEAQMKAISGVGDKKWNRYGKQCIDIITAFIQEKDKSGKKVQGSTQDVTFSYFNQGMPVTQIAVERGLSAQTIYSHLADLYEKGYAIDITKFLDKRDLGKIVSNLKEKGEPAKLKTLHARFDGVFPYDKLKLAVAHYRLHFGEKGVVRYE